VPNRRRQQQVSERGALAAAIVQHPREFVGVVMATGATVAIMVNALFLQHGPHPAPIFATRPLVSRPAAPVVAVPQPAPVVAPKVAEPRTPAQIIGDIQRELHQRGFYTGVVDGIWGAKTDGAARDFLQAAGLKADVTPSESLLHVIATSNAKPAPAAAVAAPAHKDPIAALIAPQPAPPPQTPTASPSKRVLAIQRALADFGYGQIKPTGVYDQDTQAAVEKFERERSLPVDGQISDRFVRDLAAMTGRPLE
jgi:peptidoglycan hydrolase-like protein with peptidoglycan-binding domain